MQNCSQMNKFSSPNCGELDREEALYLNNITLNILYIYPWIMVIIQIEFKRDKGYGNPNQGKCHRKTS